MKDTTDAINLVNRIKQNSSFLSAESDKLLEIIETLFHYKYAYSRALNFVDEQKYSSLPIQLNDDQFFASPTGNCCATDILIAELKKK